MIEGTECDLWPVILIAWPVNLFWGSIVENELGDCSLWKFAL
ncbi:MAG TPA: hypothetical protein VNW73_05095 [Ktedonobacteraceae bacterium]|nr:hypothetical protein [Ktedonobacteraceae bacterium]